MTDASAANPDDAQGPRHQGDASFNEANRTSETARQPFPWVRLFYSLGFAVVAWFVFWAGLLIAAGQFVLIAIKGESSSDYRGFAGRWLAYLGQVMAYVFLLSDEKPFPFGPLPSGDRPAA